MRKPEDLDMATQNDTSVVDMIFGGHDHSYFAHLNQTTGVYILKSGCDFENFSDLKVLFGVEEKDANEFIEKHGSKANLGIHYCTSLKRLYVCEKVDVDSKFPPDPETEMHVLKFTESLNEQLDLLAGYTHCDFEARFSRVRTEETNLGNWCADMVRSELQADFGLSNGGSLRANNVFPAGPITNRFVSAILPMEDRIIKLEVTG